MTDRTQKGGAPRLTAPTKLVRALCCTCGAVRTTTTRDASAGEEERGGRCLVTRRCRICRERTPHAFLRDDDPLADIGELRPRPAFTYQAEPAKVTPPCVVLPVPPCPSWCRGATQPGDIYCLFVFGSHDGSSQSRLHVAFKGACSPRSSPWRDSPIPMAPSCLSRRSSSGTTTASQRAARMRPKPGRWPPSCSRRLRCLSASRHSRDSTPPWGSTAGRGVALWLPNVLPRLPEALRGGLARGSRAVLRDGPFEPFRPTNSSSDYLAPQSHTL